MSGVWLFKNGEVKLVEDPNKLGPAAGKHKQALLHVPSGEVVSSYASLERMLAGLGWERYYEDDEADGDGDGDGDVEGDTVPYHKRGCPDLICLPKDFASFGSIDMYDIVVKNRDAFRIIDA